MVSVRVLALLSVWLTPCDSGLMHMCDLMHAHTHIPPRNIINCVGLILMLLWCGMMHTPPRNIIKCFGLLRLPADFPGLTHRSTDTQQRSWGIVLEFLQVVLVNMSCVHACMCAYICVGGPHGSVSERVHVRGSVCVYMCV